MDVIYFKRVATLIETQDDAWPTQPPDPVGHLTVPEGTLGNLRVLFDKVSGAGNLPSKQNTLPCGIKI